MAKLTQDQKSIIKALTNEFEKINAIQPEPKGLIDVGNIIGQVKAEQEFEIECKQANLAFKRLKVDAMLKDMESIRGDLKSLNLDAKLSYEGAESFEIYPTHKPYEQLEHYHRVRINYKNSHHYERKLNKITNRINCKYCVSMSVSQVSDFHATTFQDFIQSNWFKDKLKWLYEQTIK